MSEQIEGVELAAIVSDLNDPMVLSLAVLVPGELFAAIAQLRPVVALLFVAQPVGEAPPFSAQVTIVVGRVLAELLFSAD